MRRLERDVAEYDVRIEGEFSPGVWTSFSKDLVVRDGIHWKRGNGSSSPKDTVAVTGTLEFSLRNDANASGGRGYYSPNSASCRAGFGFGTWVRVVYTVSGVDYVRWTGKLRVINPISGMFGPQTTQCVAHDSMGDLSESDIREISPTFDQTSDVLLDAVFDSLPTDSQPLARDFDLGLYTVKVAFDDLGGGTKGLSVAERIVSGEQGRLFVKGDGTMRFMNSDTLALQIPVYTFVAGEASIEVPSNLDNVFNRPRLTGHPKSFSPSTIVLAAQDGALSIPAGATVELWLTYNDPDVPSTNIGGKTFVDPLAATTDYLWNANEDGSGANLTASVSVTADFFITTVKLTITNNAIVVAWKQLLQVRGIGIFDYDPITAESYTARSYGNRPIDIDLPYQADILVLNAQAAFIDATYRDLADQVSGVQFHPQRSAALMALAMVIEVGNVLEAIDAQSLPDGAVTFVNAVSLEVNADGALECYLDTGPWIVRSNVHSDTLLFTDVLTASAAVPESRIGFAVVGFSEVA